MVTQPFFLIVTRWQKPSFLKRYLVTVVIVLCVSLLRLLLNLYLEQNLSYIVFTFAVVISAWYGGLGTGLVATILSILSGMFFSPEPNSAISIQSGEEQVRVVLFVLQGAFISLLSESVQDATRWQSIILESISDIFITFDRNMRFMYVNTKAEEMLHRSRRELLGRRLVDLYPESRKTIIYKYCREALKTHQSKQFEMYDPLDERWYDISLYPSDDGVSAYYQDITRRKRVEKRLRESQLQLKRFVNANIIGVVVESLDGRIYEANDVYLDMIGYTRQDLKNGRVDWSKITPPEYKKQDEAINRALLKKGMVAPFIKEYIRKDNKRIFVLIGAVLISKQRPSPRAMAFYLDITEQKELDRKKNEFISIASHELKTPLTSVKAFTQILMKQFEQGQDKKSLYFLKNINNQLDKLNELVSDLLDVSKIEEGQLHFEKKRFSLAELIKKIVEDFQYTTKSHTILIRGKTQAFIIGDEHRIGQVLINLISNAIKYSPDSDKVIIKLTDTRDQVVVSVQDFGEGISQGDKTKIFDRFFRSKKHEGSRISGFGLGLYITKEIIDKHQGTITVESTEGKGSLFSFSLPRAE